MHELGIFPVLRIFFMKNERFQRKYGHLRLAGYGTQETFVR